MSQSLHPAIPPPRTPQATRVRVYSGDGAGWRSVRSAAAALARLVPPPYAVDAIGSGELLGGGWEASTALLVLPGGADLPYARRLNGPRGNGRIRAFVAEQGGGVLGLCAGAYYLCARVEFEAGAPPGSPPDVRPSAPPVAGDRELAFFPGVGRGAAFPGFDYATEAGAVAARLAFRVPAAAAAAFGAGGGGEGRGRGGKGAPASDTTAAAAAATTAAAAPPSTWVEARDYCNGGPFFVPYGPAGAVGGDSSDGPGAAPNGDGDGDGDPWPFERDPRFEVLARYGFVRHPRADERAEVAPPTPGLAADAAAAAAAAAAATAAAEAEGPAACPARGPLAAVRVAVGAGCAVLCATHPELSADWLDPLGGSHEHEQRGEAEARAAAAAAAVAAAAAGGAAAAAAAPFVSGSESDGKARAAAAAVAAAAAAPHPALPKQQPRIRREDGSQEEKEEDDDSDDEAPPPPPLSALASHTAALRAELEACRAARELFLAVLVYEALRR